MIHQSKKQYNILWSAGVSPAFWAAGILPAGAGWKPAILNAAWKAALHIYCMAIYLGIGSNLGDRLANVTAALTNFSILQQSSVYETEPVDFREQPWFFNAVINIETPLSPEKLLEFCQDIENRLGRKREVPKGPRVIDIDMLFYENFILTGPLLILPHPEISNRRFVLEPMNEIAPNFVHPVLQKTISQLLSDCNDRSIVRKL